MYIYIYVSDGELYVLQCIAISQLFYLHYFTNTIHSMYTITSPAVPQLINVRFWQFFACLFYETKVLNGKIIFVGIKFNTCMYSITTLS